MSWLYNKEVITNLSQLPTNSVGFVYKITNPDTEQWYIGKKLLYNLRTLPPLKGTKRKRKVVKESEWLTYQSSNKEVQQWINPVKVILEVGYNKKHLTYLEVKYIFQSNSLEDPKSLNSNVLGKFFKDEFSTLNGEK